MLSNLYKIFTLPPHVLLLLPQELFDRSNAYYIKASLFSIFIFSTFVEYKNTRRLLTFHLKIKNVKINRLLRCYSGDLKSRNIFFFNSIDLFIKVFVFNTSLWTPLRTYPFLRYSPAAKLRHAIGWRGLS